jgi:hypothetical protein
MEIQTKIICCNDFSADGFKLFCMKLMGQLILGEFFDQMNNCQLLLPASIYWGNVELMLEVRNVILCGVHTCDLWRL